MPILFGTFNRSTASSAEVELSQSLQIAFANFVKNPNASPAPHWPAYQPEVSGSACNPLAKFVDQGNVDFGNFVKNPNLSLAPHWSPYEPEIPVKACTPTLAKIAYQENVDFGNFIQPVQPDSTVSTRNDDGKFSPFMNFSSINRMDRAMYGTNFWITVPKEHPTSA